MLSFLILSFARPQSACAQDFECGTVIPPSWSQKLLEDAEAIKGYSAVTENPRIVPVKITQILRNAQFGTVAQLTQAQVEERISAMNTAFLGSGISFEFCGPIHYIVNNQSGTLNAPAFNSPRYTQFEFTTGAMEIYVGELNGSAYANPPCPFAWQTSNPVYSGNGCYEPDNMMSIHRNEFFTNTFIHETGHHLGLLHTFHPGVGYSAPPTPTQTDRPYLVLSDASATTPLDPNWFARELVIRSFDDSKDFSVVNSDRGGDLVPDTPADCNPNATAASAFPGCSGLAINKATCEFDASLLNFKDYNGDSILPTPNGESLRNYMSYWWRDCLDHFTEGQFNRARFMFDNYRIPQYGVCGSFSGNVSLWDTEKRVPKVSIRLKQDLIPGSTIDKQTNTTTDGNGEFRSMLFDAPVTADVYHNGLNPNIFDYLIVPPPPDSGKSIR